MSDLIEQLQKKYPFMTLCIYAGDEYVGVIQNQDDKVTTIYDFGTLVTLEEKEAFIDLASQWWWESNHSIPINIFLKGDWDQFRPCLKTFNNNNLEILTGPVTCLKHIVRKKTKKKSVTLVRKAD